MLGFSSLIGLNGMIWNELQQINLAGLGLCRKESTKAEEFESHTLVHVQRERETNRVRLVSIKCKRVVYSKKTCYIFFLCNQLSVSHKFCSHRHNVANVLERIYRPRKLSTQRKMQFSKVSFAKKCKNQQKFFINFCSRKQDHKISFFLSTQKWELFVKSSQVRQ